MSSYLHRRHFTIEQARRMLPTVRQKVEELVRLKNHLDSIHYDIFKHQYLGGKGPNGQRYHPAELERLVELMHYFEKEGLVIKSIQEGLVDFPCVRDNREEAYLCWKLGEADIDFWHTINGGFAGRQPLAHL